MEKYAAVDLGAESGRIIVGDVREIEEIYRFENRPIRIGDNIFWDVLNIFAEIKTGLKRAFARHRIRSIGLDSWGVDFALLDCQGDLIGSVYHYRDPRTDDVPDRVFSLIPKREIYEETGIQYMAINTVHQLYAAKQQKPGLVDQACSLLTLPNLMHYWLTGVMANEYSHASTTQLYNPRTRDWSWRIIDALGFKRDWFGDILAPGTNLGSLLPHVAEEIGASAEVAVIASATHDTACAVAAIPAPGKGKHAYISSGTWSLLGIETPEPIISDKSYAYNFTNEGGADGGIRFLKNITGLWIIQECKRHWDRIDRQYSYGELTDLAREFGPAEFGIDANDPRFLKPGLIEDSMPDRIIAACREAGQRVPQSPAEFVRGVLQSLAGLYADSVRELEEAAERPVEALYIIGGGSRNSLLCELTARAAGLPVFAGPVEATAIGNILVQAISMGDIESIDRGRELVRDSYAIAEFSP
ncbi:MAG: rhamnulokinase [Spirochaetaceae bacterium]|nr:MAG: rhamnulokinase [Spirochaetaceae bacterium]